MALSSTNGTNGGGGGGGWFQGAPITKLCCMLWIVAHAVVPSHNLPVVFQSTGELVVGMLFLAQHLKHLEREMSSRQFVVWLSWIWTFGASVHWMTIQTVELESRFLGPYLWMGGILYWYLRYVPRLHPKFFTIVGIPLSEKALQYTWGFYLLGHHGMTSIWQGLVGGIGAAIYFATVPRNILPLSIPNFIVNVFPWETIGSLLFLDPPSPVYMPLMMTMAMGMSPTSNNNNNNAHHHHNHHPMMGRGMGSESRSRRVPPPTPPPPSPPSTENMEQLMAMGFEEDQVRQALQQTGNNLERAADRLLSGL